MSLQAVMSPDLRSTDSRSPDTQPQPLARRAALTLHALGAADRAWLLAQLPPVQREQLQAMLRELEALGIPASGNLLQDLLGAADAGVRPEAGASQAARAETSQLGSSTGFQQQQAALGRLDAALVARILQSEPAGLIAQLLHIHAWPWRQAVLEQLGLVKRRRVEEFLDGLRRQVRPKAPDALHRSLVAAVYRRVVDAADTQEQGALQAQAAQRAAATPASAAGRGVQWPRWLSRWLKGRS